MLRQPRTGSIRLRLAVAIGLAVACSACGSGGTAHTQPAKSPAGVRSAVARIFTGFVSGDLGICSRRVFAVEETDTHVRCARVVADAAAAGTSNGRTVAADQRAFRSALHQATVTIRGDTASVTIRTWPQPLRFTWSHARWLAVTVPAGMLTRPKPVMTDRQWVAAVGGVLVQLRIPAKAMAGAIPSASQGRLPLLKAFLAVISTKAVVETYQPAVAAWKPPPTAGAATRLLQRLLAAIDRSAGLYARWLAELRAGTATAAAAHGAAVTYDEHETRLLERQFARVLNLRRAALGLARVPLGFAY